VITGQVKSNNGFFNVDGLSGGNDEGSGSKISSILGNSSGQKATRVGLRTSVLGQGSKKIIGGMQSSSQATIAARAKINNLENISSNSSGSDDSD